MTTLAEVRNRIKSNLQITSTEHDADIDGCVRSAIAQYQNLPMWFLEKKGTATLLEGDDFVTLPSDFAAHRRNGVRLLVGDCWRAHLRGFDKLQWDDLNNNHRSQLTTRQPCLWASFAAYLYVDSYADQDYTVEISYYKKDETLPVSDGDTSVWLADGMDAVRTQAMAMFKDEALEYEVTDKDWGRAKMYLDKLTENNNLRVS